MKLSIFQAANKCFIATEKKQFEAQTDEKNKASEIMVQLLQLAISDANPSHVFFSSGPNSFTATRIVYSIVCGLKIVNPNIKLTAVSSFLTYEAAIRCPKKHTIAISTQKNDFYCMDCTDGVLENSRITVPNGLIFYDTSNYEENLAITQLYIEKSPIFEKNKNLISYSDKITYATTPQYKTCS